MPSVLFGPGGAGLHSTEEYVMLRDVLACRDVLATMAGDLVRGWAARVSRRAPSLACVSLLQVLCSLARPAGSRYLPS